MLKPNPDKSGSKGSASQAIAVILPTYLPESRIEQASKEDVLAGIVPLLSRGRPEDSFLHPIPDSVCPVLYMFIAELIVSLDRSDRDMLWQFALRLIDSNDSAKEAERAGQLTDWAVREIAPLAIEAEGFSRTAARLRELKPIKNLTDAAAARELGEEISSLPPLTTEAARAASAATRLAASVFVIPDMQIAYAVGAAPAAARLSGADPELLLRMQLDLLDSLCPE